MQSGSPFTLLSTAGGTLLTIATLQTEEVIKTIVLAVAGTITSFVTATFLSWLARRFRRNK
jgi:hypothetical protein